MIVKNEVRETMSFPMEIKRITPGWYEKRDNSENELLYLEELLAIDSDLTECDNILSEVNLQIGYRSHRQEIYEIADKRQQLWSFITALPDYIESHLDEPLRQSLNQGACETISRIHMEDFTVENTLGLTVIPDSRQYLSEPQVKDCLSLGDFIGNALGEHAEGNRIPGRNNECVEEFAAIFVRQYEGLRELGLLDKETTLEAYLDQFALRGEHDHKVDQPFHMTLASNLLDLTIIKPIIESSCGYDLVTREDLTEMEQNLKLVGAVVDLITLAIGLKGIVSAGKSLSLKQMGRLALGELTADVTVTTIATIGQYQNWPPGLTLLLSLVGGITVGFVENSIVFSKGGVEIYRTEIPEENMPLLEPFLNTATDDVIGSGTNAAGTLVGGVEGGTASKVGDFTNLDGSTVDDILDRIPDEATLRELHPVAGGSTEGFEFKWTQDGKTYRVRVHNADPGAPSGSNAANGWIVRVQRGKQYYDYTINDFQPARYTNPNGDFFDENIMNNTHIPIQNPYEP